MNIKFFPILLTLIISSSISLFATPIATITALKGFVTIQRDSESIVATKGFLINKKDNIYTQDNTKVQLVFNDDTIVSVGKNSHFNIQEYIFQENQEPVAKFKLLKGAMRSITGKIGKIAPQNFTVITKAATIGIRGTNFGIILAKKNSFQAYCTSGTISIKSKLKKHLIREGFFMVSSISGKTKIRKFTSNDLEIIKSHDFLMSRELKNISIKNSKITAKVQVSKNVTIKNSNLGTQFTSDNIKIEKSKITSDTTVKSNSHIENSNLGNLFTGKKIEVKNSNISSKVIVGKSSVVKNSNLGNKLKGKVNNSNISSNVNVGAKSHIENSNLGIELED